MGLVSAVPAAGAEPDDGEETETAPESETVDDSVTRCICDFEHDDGYMICCDRCSVWQHVDCVGLDRTSIPDEYLCEQCQPRRLDRRRARSLQLRRRQKLLTDSDDSPDSGGEPTAAGRPAGGPRVRRPVKRRQSRLQQPAERSRLSVKKRRLPRSSGRTRPVSDAGAEGWSLEQPARKLRCWIDEYEDAVTNHYSAELRVRLASMRTGAVPPPPAGPQRCAVATVGPDERGLVAALPLLANTTLVEFRGRCLLHAEYRQQFPLQSKRYQPHVLHYRFPRDALHVCIDARQYGNVARFVRRSCRPNAQIRHVVDRGALHLHVVAVSAVSRGSEITIAHDQPGSRQLVCACGRTDGCPVAACQPTNGTISNGKTTGPARRRRRRSSARPPTPSPSAPSGDESSEEGRDAPPAPLPPPSPPPPPPPPPVSQQPTPRKKSPHRSPAKAAEPRPMSMSPGETAPAAAGSPATKDEPKKLTREERKIEAIMKAFERMEKKQQRQQQAAATGDSPRKASKQSRDDSSRNNSAEELASAADRNARKRGRKGSRARLLSSPRRQSAADSAGSEALSGDEAPPPLPPPPPPPPPASAPCSMAGPPLSAPLSAPVSGLNAHGFRFPKTKKMLMTEWLNETVVTVVRHVSDGGDPCELPSMYTRGARSPPVQRRASLSVGPAPAAASPPAAQLGGSAKKRWLRQAISEEGEPEQLNGNCASPVSRPESPGATDYFTPLKKRRLARSSVSSELTWTPPPESGCEPPALRQSPEQRESPLKTEVIVATPMPPHSPPRVESMPPHSPLKMEPMPPRSLLKMEPMPPRSPLKMEPMPPHSPLKMEPVPLRSPLKMESQVSAMNLDVRRPPLKLDVRPSPLKLGLNTLPTKVDWEAARAAVKMAASLDSERATGSPIKAEAGVPLLDPPPGADQTEAQPGSRSPRRPAATAPAPLVKEDLAAQWPNPSIVTLASPTKTEQLWLVPESGG
ncbi:inactive histone-lysine N-methyltransferase 2E-like [Pollicipes pollicipes]|uniref:inactive histone-lysine N-methyltransferase 2E-like n=1 Tax=Pollicipes pollicipes TaxID=41117 RepID=UPI0018853ECD|nr:inactive histone-lysine N-methyltransferase 2E-like [Pollicipes pollicipes]